MLVAQITNAMDQFYLPSGNSCIFIVINHANRKLHSEFSGLIAAWVCLLQVLGSLHSLHEETRRKGKGREGDPERCPELDHSPSFLCALMAWLLYEGKAVTSQ